MFYTAAGFSDLAAVVIFPPPSAHWVLGLQGEGFLVEFHMVRIKNVSTYKNFSKTIDFILKV
ncbi:MAG: hypothetical protein Q4C66_01195 [Lachnospiraceae bacterium]|nr:hypothetical protein [Lachnospiraceae bacterium]